MLCVLAHDCLQTCNNRNMSQCTVFDKVASCVSHLTCVVLWVCGQTARGRKRMGVSFSWSTEGRLMVLMPDFPKVIQVVVWRGLMPGWSISWAGDVLPPSFSQMARCGTLTLSWSRGEKRCRTSLGPCWWRAARPIRRRGVSHHVTASPIAIYFTIGQMKRLILTICSLMCFSPSHSFSLRLSLRHPSLPLSLPSLPSGWKKLLALAETRNFKNHLLCWVTFQDTINGGNRVDR